MVVIPYTEYEAQGKPRESLLSFFENSPLYGLDLDLSREAETTDQMRDIEL